MEYLVDVLIYNEEIMCVKQKLCYGSKERDAYIKKYMNNPEVIGISWVKFNKKGDITEDKICKGDTYISSFGLKTIWE